MVDGGKSEAQAQGGVRERGICLVGRNMRGGGGEVHKRMESFRAGSVRFIVIITR